MDRRTRCLTAVALLILVPTLAWAHDASASYVERLDAAVAEGRLEQDEALVYAFQYGFEPDALPPDWTPATRVPLKCATPLLQRFEAMRSELSSETIKLIEGYLAPAPTADKAVYLSPLGYFNLTYETSGADAVPTTDVDPANGIPDYVERCAEYLDTSWETEITTLGFTAPPNQPYPISFESMSFYGYTSIVSGAATRIVLHNTFVGFPPNDDPDGDVLGAAKATCAHEFKHASQRAQSGWSEGGWVELDATWTEDMVFDATNDYYNYLPSGSGISDPDLSLFDGGSGSYEDCIWQLWMSETFGTSIVTDIWNWRSTHTSESMLNTYDTLLSSYGSSLVAGFAEYAAWNAVTGSRTIPGVGYEEAASYPTGPATGIGVYPNAQTGSLAPLASQTLYCTGFSGLTGTLDYVFNGDDAASLSLKAVIRRTDGSGVIETIALNGTNGAAGSLGVPLESMSWAVLVVVNTGTAATSSWSLVLNRNEVVPIPAIQLSTNAVNKAQAVDLIDTESLLVSNVGEAGSMLTYVGTVTDIIPTAFSSMGAVGPTVPRTLAGDLGGPAASLHATDRYAGDCVLGNDDVSNIQGQYTTWWTGNESYAVKVDPVGESCSCGAGFNVRAVHMVLYLDTMSAPKVRAHLMTDAGACDGPGSIIATSADITVANQPSAGYYDIEIPCDFVCTDADSGPYYIVFEFLDAAGPVGIPVDTTPTSCVNYNLWDASGYQELVDGYGFAGDLLIWADVDCCGAAVPEVGVVSPDGGDMLAVGEDATLSWSATVLTDVKVELSRDAGSTWEVLFASTPNDGSESWTVTGPTSAECLLRVGATDDSVQDVSDALFTIHTVPSWLYIVPTFPVVVPEGSSSEFFIGFDTNGMAPGLYTGYVMLSHDAPTPAELITVTLEVTTSTTAGGPPPSFGIAGNHPNPFNPSTRIRYALAVEGRVVLDIVDLQGRVVRTLVDAVRPQGVGIVEWDGRDDAGRQAGSGTYLARIRSAGATASHKILLAK